MSGRRRAAVVGLAVALAGVGGWLALGGGSGGASGGGSGGEADAGGPLVVLADSALRAPLTQYAKLFGTERAKGVLTESLHKVAPGTTKVSLSFAATKALAARIRGGARPDVVAGESPVIDGLYRAGLVQEPITVAAIDRGDVLTVFRHQGPATTVARLRDALKRGARVAIVSPASATGARARALIARLPAAQRRALLANARLREPDAAAVIRQVADRRADAGILFGSELAKAHGPTYVVGFLSNPRHVTMSVAVVEGTKRPLAASAFAYGLIDINSAAYYALLGSGYTAGPAITHRPRKPPPVNRTGV